MAVESQTVPDWDMIAARAAQVRGDPAFHHAARCFCERISALFAEPHPAVRHIDDAGGYAVLAILLAARAGGRPGWTPTRAIIDVVAPARLASERRVTRMLASMSDRGLVQLCRIGGDLRVRHVRADTPVLDFFGRWHDAHLSPLRLLAGSDLRRALGGDSATAVVWQAVVVAMVRHHGFMMIHPFPAIGDLMRRARGYLAMLQLRLDPATPSSRFAARFRVSESQARLVLSRARALDPSLVDAWLTTELAFATLVADACLGQAFDEPVGETEVGAAALARRSA